MITQEDMVHAVIVEVLAASHIPKHQLFSRDRTQHVACWRQYMCWLLRRCTALSFPAIGLVVKRDHSTVIHDFNKVEREMRSRGITVLDRIKERVLALKVPLPLMSGAQLRRELESAMAVIEASGEAAA